MNHSEEELMRQAESHRRELATMDATPVAPLTLDYSGPGMFIQRAMHHLDEALPNGQRLRAEIAYRMLQRGTAELGVWMRAKGYDV